MKKKAALRLQNRCDIIRSFMMKKALYLTFALLCLGVRFSDSRLLYANEKLVDRVVAVVNKDVITESELDPLFQPILLQYQQTYQGSDLMDKLGEVRHKLILQLIEDRLVLQEATKLGVDVSEGEVNDRVEDLKQSYKAEGAANFEDAIKAQGVTTKALRDRIKDQIAIQKLHFSEVRRKVVVSPLEVENYYKEHESEFEQKEKRMVWVITIPKNDLAATKGMMDEKAKKKAEAILKDLKKGKVFEEIAKKESQDPHAKNGGLIGEVSKGDMAENIDQVLFQTPEGQMTDILETERAYYIFKVGVLTTGKKLSFEEAREKIESFLYKQKANTRFEEWMDELKKKAFISIR